MGLNTQQAAVLQELLDFVALEGRTTFSLQGGAGVGKTYLVGVLVKELQALGHRVLLAAPTHKACRVLRSKLDAWGVRWTFKPQREVPAGIAIVDTTAALLGIRPVIDDDQTEDEVKFKPTSGGSISRLFDGNLGRTAVLIIDEVSMLGREELQQLAQYVRGRGKLICVGDEGQLPPVKKQAIDFVEDFEQSALLDVVVRQAEGSAIVKLAWAIRSVTKVPDLELELNNFDLLGGDITKSENVPADYVRQLILPVDDESQRAVYIAYRNALVDNVQEACCQKLYGHGRKDFRQGQLVLATQAGYREENTWVDAWGVRRATKWPKMVQLVANADQLRVVEISDNQHAVYGREVELDRVDLPHGAANRRFETHYLSEDQLGDKSHPFNVKKAELLAAAKALQVQLKQSYNADLDKKRKDAWGEYFKHQQRVIGFSHPFAITSHKSQGSTYREAYVGVSDLLRFDRRALYVAVTRPRERLVV